MYHTYALRTVFQFYIIFILFYLLLLFYNSCTTYIYIYNSNWLTFDRSCRSVPVYFEWFSYLSWFRYGNEALLINQWSEVESIECTRSNATCPKSGRMVLQTFNFKQVLVRRDSCYVFYFAFFRSFTTTKLAVTCWISNLFLDFRNTSGPILSVCSP